MKNLLFICMCSMFNFLVLSSDQPKAVRDYMKLYSIPEEYKMYELVTLNKIKEEFEKNGILPLAYSQYWGIIVNEPDIYYECVSISAKQDFIKTIGDISIKRIVAEYILVMHLQNHHVNLNEY